MRLLALLSGNRSNRFWKLNPAFVFWERERNIFHISALYGLRVGPSPICCSSCVAGSPEMPVLLMKDGPKASLDREGIPLVHL